MRIIAAVTLIFLPGTFVATIFSTGLFDWSSGDPTPAGGDGGGSGAGGGRMISKYIWVYFMLTGVLTAVVLIGWGLFSYIQKRKMTRLLSLDVDEEWGGEAETWARKKRTETEVTLVNRRSHRGRYGKWVRELL